MDEHPAWAKRDLSVPRYACLWADAIYSNALPDVGLCLLVFIGVMAHGHHKELLVFKDGYRESEASWYKLPSGLRSRSLQVLAKRATGDDAMGFWNARAKVFPDTRTHAVWCINKPPAC